MKSTETLKKTSSNRSSFRLRSPSLNTLRLRRIFDLFDQNGDEIITTEELSLALTRLGLEVADQSELESAVSAFSRPGIAGLGFSDFELLHSSLGDSYFFSDSNGESHATDKAAEEENERDLSEAFKVFDEDGDGFISAVELQAVLSKLGFKEGEEFCKVQRMITSVDRNCDGRVDFFEFKDMMRGIVVVPN